MRVTPGVPMLKISKSGTPAQSRFVADVSHDLGGSLTRMHPALALLQRRFAETNSEELEDRHVCNG